MMRMTMTVFPFLKWVRTYSKEDAQKDVWAGLTTGIMLVAQSMAYALLANLPPVYGLYSSITPLFFYFLFGTCKQLGVGPVAVISLLISSSVPADLPDETRVLLAQQLAFFSGLFQVLLGAMKTGFVVNFIAHPVVTSFTSAAAILIALTQIRNLFGINAVSDHIPAITMYRICEKLPDAQWTMFLFGFFTIAILFGLKKYNAKSGRNIPGPMIVCVLGCLIVYLGDMTEYIDIVGAIPSSFDEIRFPLSVAPGAGHVDPGALIMSAFVIALIGYIESISVAKRCASKKGYKVKPNQEFLAVGAANLLGSCFGGFPVAGSFSRSSLNLTLDMRSQTAAVVSAATVAISVVTLADVLFYLPKAVLAGIIIVAVVNLVAMQEWKLLYRLRHKDLVVCVCTFIGTLGLGPEFGILIGVGTSFIVMVVNTVQMPIKVWVAVPEGSGYSELDALPDELPDHSCVVLKLQGALSFLSAAKVNTTIDNVVRSFGNGSKVIVFDCAQMHEIDSSGLHLLSEVIAHCNKFSVTILMAKLKKSVLVTMDMFGVLQSLKYEPFSSVEEAIGFHSRCVEEMEMGLYNDDTALNTRANASSTLVSDNTQPPTAAAAV
eukprot:GFYU01017521.1.p1 GENE.GFYU01017521.1~~GFYU01017521.1.p1  ORF type:complete len:657 (-),score=242.08 GFYU01017521.1:535-2346(-)